jgi:chromosome segregation ATPase
MAEVTNELIYEVLKAMQTRLSNIEGSIVEIKTELQAVRGHMLAIQTDIANLYAGQANVEVRLGRIERRLELTDSPVN